MPACAVCMLVFILNITIYTHRHETGLEKWHLPHRECELVLLIFRQRFECLTVSLDYLLLLAALIGETHVHVVYNHSRKQLQWFILGIQWQQHTSPWHHLSNTHTHTQNNQYRKRMTFTLQATSNQSCRKDRDEMKWKERQSQKSRQKQEIICLKHHTWHTQTTKFNSIKSLWVKNIRM